MWNSIFKKSVASTISAIFGLTQVLMYAPVAQATDEEDRITQYSAAGKTHGKEILNWAQNNLPTLSGSGITIKRQDGGKDITIDDYNTFSGTNNEKENHQTSNTKATIDDLAELAGDQDAFEERGNSMKDTLMSKLQNRLEGANVTIEEDVYEILKGLGQTKQGDLLDDSMMDTMRNWIENGFADYVENLATCDVETATISNTKVVHQSKLEECQQVLDRSGECEIDHDYGGGVVSLLDSTQLNISTCDPVNGYSCTQIWLGKIGNNYLPGKGCQSQCKRMESHPSTCKKYEWQDVPGATDTHGIIKSEQEKVCVEWNYEDYCVEYHTVCSCALFFENIHYQLKNINAIVSAQLVYAAYDDYMRVRVGPVANPTIVYSGPKDPFPFDEDGNPVATGSCELSTHWIWDPTGLRKTNSGFGCTESSCSINTRNNTQPAVDVTSLMKSIGEGGIGTFRWEAAASGAGEAYALLKIYYDPSLIADNDTWGPTGCLDAALGIEDGVATGTVTCTEMPSTDSSGCVLIDMVPICPNAVADSPLSGIDKMCRKVQVSSNFSFYKGDTGCWQGYLGLDKNGNPLYEEVCGGDNIGGNLDTCTDLEEKGCTWVSTECTPEMMGASGTCYVADSVYDCGEDVEIHDDNLQTDYTCQGLRCVGTECTEVVETKNTSFARVAAMMNTLEEASMDMTCTGTDEDGNVTGLSDVTCTVFKGEAGTCKIAVGGWQNCCKDNPQNPSIYDYMSSIYGVAKSTQALYSFGQTTNYYMVLTGRFNGEPGATGVLADYAGQFAEFIDKSSGVILDKLQYVDSEIFNKAFTTAAENVAGIFEGAWDWGENLLKSISNAIDAIKEKLYEWTHDLLTKVIGNLTGTTTGVVGGGVGGTVGQDAAKNAATSVMQGIGTAVTVVGYVYMAYQIANMLVQLLYACEEEEMEMVSKRAIQACHFLGSYCKKKILGACIVKIRSYCCFKTPLGRIINEQIRLQTKEVTDSNGVTTTVPRVAGWGDAKNPNCSGLSLTELSDIDWDAVDLSEWVALQKANDLYFDTEDTLTLESLTGTGQKTTSTQLTK